VGWVRDSDDFYDHPKLADLDLAAWGLRAWGTAWANRNLSDGVVPYSIVKRMDPDGMASGALIDAGVWHLEDGCIRIHDYLDYQPSAEQVRSKREKERERWQRRASSEPPPPQLRAEYAATPTASQPQPQPIDQELLGEFESWWHDYPVKKDKAAAFKAFKARRRDGVSFEDLSKARINYLADQVLTETQFLKRGATFLNGKDGPWSEFVDGIYVSTRVVDKKPDGPVPVGPAYTEWIPGQA
jgi:hypothetical protein